MKQFKVMTMGVINITPNSFSDGGQFNDSSALKTRFEYLSQYRDLIYDLGAESTAPFNDPIGIEEEKSRLELALEVLKEFSPHSISLDTYRGETAHWFFNKALELGFKSSQFIWNDVSGQFDEEVREYLKRFPEGHYIYSHNLAPSRELTSKHMNYNCAEEDIVEHLINYFRPFSKEERVWFDPCFGFSKKYEENWELIHRWDQVLKALANHTWIIGLSKKSFLRRFLCENLKRELPKEEALIKSEWIHRDLISKFIGISRSMGCKKDLVFRVHDPDIMETLGLIP